jgi:hypothetical protein
MSTIDSRQAGPGAVFEQARQARLTHTLASPWLTGGLVLFAIAQQIAGHLDCDVSWFITFAEKFVDGKIPYVDVTDPNPPASFLAFAPAVWLARALHVAVEPIVATFVFLFSGVSIGVSALMFRCGARRSREDWGLLLNVAVFLLMLAPELVFAEREHLALLALAPMLAALSVAAEGGRAPLVLRLIAGAGAGLAVCFKPHFALAIALPALALAWRERSPRLLSTAEMAAAFVVCAGYAVVILVFFPAYRDYALPIIADVYQPARDSWTNLALLTLAPFHIALLVALIAAAAEGFVAPPVAPRFVAPAAARVCAWASLGFLVSFFVQGKGWSNHAYPGLALVLLAWSFLALDRHPRAKAARNGRLFKFVFLPALLASPAMFGAGKLLADIEEHPGLRAAILRHAPAHPRVIAMARQLDFGHPATRQVEGTWVGRPNALWTASFAAHLLNDAADSSYRARLDAYRRRDLAGFAEDVREGRPDVVIVEDKETREWVGRRPETAAALDGYEKAGNVDEIEIWVRKAE